MYKVSRSWNWPSFSGIAICTMISTATNTIWRQKAVAKASNFLLFLCGIVSGNSSNIAIVLDGGGENRGQTGDSLVFVQKLGNHRSDPDFLPRIKSWRNHPRMRGFR